MDFKERMYFLFTPDEGYGKIVWNVLVLKRFFDTGYSQSGYIKYAVAMFGLSSRDVGQTMLWAVYYGILCFVWGFLWHLFKLVDAETAIGNRFNDFIKEMMRWKKGEVKSTSDDNTINL